MGAETVIALGVYVGQTPEFGIDALGVHELSRELVENGETIRARVRRCKEERVAM